MWGRLDTSALRLPGMPVDPEAVRRGGARAARLSLLGARGLGRILWRHRLLVLAGPVVGLALSAAYVATLPPLFEAETRVAVGRPAGFDPRAVGPGPGAPSEAEKLAGQLPLIRSRANAERLVDGLDLQRSAEFNPRLDPDGTWASDGRGVLAPLSDAWLDAASEAALTDAERAARLRAQMVAAVLPRIQAEAAGDSVLSLRFVAADPSLAAAGATALAELFLDHRQQASRQERQRERQRLGEEVERLALAIRATESAIADLRATLPAGPEPASERNLFDLTGELAYWRSERAALEARLGRAGGPLVPDGSPERAAQSVDAALPGELDKLEAGPEPGLAERSQADGGQDRQLSGLRAEPVALDDDKRAEIELGLGALKREIAIIRSRETALEGRIEALQNQLAEPPVPGDLETLERQAEADRELLLTHVARVEELDAAPQAGELDARVVVPAVVPREPKYPRVALIYGTALCGALLVGGLLALGAEAWARARA